MSDIARTADADDALLSEARKRIGGYVKRHQQAAMGNEIDSLGDGLYRRDIEAVLADADRLRALVGPDCPRCGMPLYSHHIHELIREQEDEPLVPGFRGRDIGVRCESVKRNECRISDRELIERHPGIAKAIRLAVAA